MVKVGGSLFSWDQLAVRLTAWLVGRRVDCCLLIAGGGPLVRQLHDLTDRFRVGAEDAHWLAVRTMGLQARLLGALLDLPVFEDLDDCLRSSIGDAPQAGAAPDRPCTGATLRGRVAVFDPLRLIQDDAGNSLPAGWHVTSDSIAAFVARQARAARLVLLKSVGSADVTIADAAARGWVDEHFPRAIGDDVTVEWVNLRSTEP